MNPGEQSTPSEREGHLGTVGTASLGEEDEEVSSLYARRYLGAAMGGGGFYEGANRRHFLPEAPARNERAAARSSRDRAAASLLFPDRAFGWGRNAT